MIKLRFNKNKPLIKKLDITGKDLSNGMKTVDIPKLSNLIWMFSSQLNTPNKFLKPVYISNNTSENKVVELMLF